LAFATFLVWRLRTGACGVGACGFWRYRMPPFKLIKMLLEKDFFSHKWFVENSKPVQAFFFYEKNRRNRFLLKC